MIWNCLKKHLVMIHSMIILISYRSKWGWMRSVSKLRFFLEWRLALGEEDMALILIRADAMSSNMRPTISRWVSSNWRLDTREGTKDFRFLRNLPCDVETLFSMLLSALDDSSPIGMDITEIEIRCVEKTRGHNKYLNRAAIVLWDFCGS